MTTRSELLAHGVIQSSATDTTLFTVPLGRTAIVKSIHLMNGAGSTEPDWQMRYRAGAGLPTRTLIRRSIASGAELYISVWNVVPVGGSMIAKASISNTNMHYWISGAMLNN